MRLGLISRVERKTIVTQTYFWNPCLGAMAPKFSLFTERNVVIFIMPSW